MIYKKFLRPLLFNLPPESVHQATLHALRAVGSLRISSDLVKYLFKPNRQTPVSLFGLDFPNRVGLAAGFDKDAQAVKGLSALGFGHIEVGTVTLRPQSGSPKPRLFRLPMDEAIINRMGFPGIGADHIALKLSRLGKQRRFILGVNIGKNKDTPLAEAHQDYIKLIEVFAPFADYLAINISSPNTVGLRQLQHQEFLGNLLTKVTAKRDIEQDKLGKKVPLLIKLAPDLSGEELDQIIDTILAKNIDGVIAANTTIRRDNLTSVHSSETGGLSGRPLADLSTGIISQIAARAGDSLPIIGVGGISNPADMRVKINAGASLVQVYTGLVYEGPGLVKRLIENTVE